jgi:hypothetical protein
MRTQKKKKKKKGKLEWYGQYCEKDMGNNTSSPPAGPLAPHVPPAPHQPRLLEADYFEALVFSPKKRGEK